MLKRMLDRTTAALGRVDLFRRTPLAGVVEEHPIVAIDVGSRGGFEADLDPIAWAVDAVGFEPNPEELDRLRHQIAEHASHGARSDTYPLRSAEREALAGCMSRSRPSPLPCSSTTRALARGSASRRCSRSTASSTWKTMTLDDALTRFAIPAPHYLKLDIEGAELEVLSSSPRALSSTLVLKTEVAFVPMRRGQPLATDVDLFLRGHGFQLHRPRRAGALATQGRTSRIRSSRPQGPLFPGQIAHGDFLYFREPDAIPSAEVPSVLRAAVLAMAHGFFDYASALLAKPEVERHLREHYRLDWTRVVRSASLALGRRAWASAFSEHLRRIVTFLRSAKVIASVGASR